MKNFAVLAGVRRHNGAASLVADPEAKRNIRETEFKRLVDLLFQHPCVVAVIGSCSGQSVTGICEAIATEASAGGSRVVIVSVQTLLASSPVTPPDQTVFSPGPVGNVWFWPARDGLPREVADNADSEPQQDWLDSLRLQYDYILLDCPAPDTTPASASIAALADSAVLAVDTARTQRYQLLVNQRSLQLCGVKLSGCILVNPR